MKRTLIALAGGFSLALAAPLQAQAQDDTDPAQQEMEQMMAGLAGLFQTEPLTTEQEARLPAARRIIGLMIPEGTMGDIMGKMIDDMVRPMMEMGPSPARAKVATSIGVTPFELDLDDEQFAELATLFDPAWEERAKREFDAFPSIMRDMMTLMEPGMRKAMSELYAIRFTESELADIEAFFATETGRKYASESFAMASDPRIMAASMESLPALMGSISDLEARIEEATADLPTVKAYDDLSEEERARVSELTGYSEEEIRSYLEMGESWEDDAWGEEAWEDEAWDEPGAVEPVDEETAAEAQKEAEAAADEAEAAAEAAEEAVDAQ